MSEGARSIIVTDREGASDLLHLSPDRYACISIVDNDGTPVPGLRFATAGLVVRMDDIERPKRNLIVPDKQHVWECIHFARETHEPLIVHCNMGISRSTAIGAAVIADQHDDPKRGVREVFRQRPGACPNTRIISLADDALGFGGLLVLAEQEETIARRGAIYTGRVA